MSYKRIIFTGQSGLRPEDKDYPIKKFYTEFLTQNYKFFKVEDFIKENYQKKYSNKKLNSIWLGSFLQQTPFTILQEWENAIKKIKSKVSDKDNYIISFHSVFFNNRTIEYIIPAQEKLLRELKPQVFITLIDDIYDIHKRLHENGHIFCGSLGGSDGAQEGLLELLRILDWRAREIMVTRHLAHELNADHYLIAVKHGYNLFNNLIEKKLRTCYISHPITQVRVLQQEGKNTEASNIINEIHNFESLISEKFSAFLPTTIDEFRIKRNEHNRIIPLLFPRWDEEKYMNPADIVFKKIKSAPEIIWDKKNIKDKNLSPLLNILATLVQNQIDVRDHILVEQSECLAVYRPCYNGIVSGGVSEEIDYYNNLPKRKYCLIYLPEEDIMQLKIKQFELLLEKEIKNENLNNRNRMKSIKLEKKQITDLIRLFNKRKELNQFFSDLLVELNLRINLVDGPLKKDKSARAQEYQINFIDTYLKNVKVILNRYKKADLVIKKTCAPEKIIKQLLDEINKKGIKK